MLDGSLAALAVFWVAVLGSRKPLRIRGMALALPSPALALGQTVVSTLDLIAASLVLWVFLQDVPGLTFTAFLATYAIALLLSVISQVPGGLGVFEGAFLWLTAPTFGASHPIIVAGLVLYRVVYYFIPLASAGVLLLAHDLHANRARFAKVGRVASRLVPATVPQVFSLLLFLTGGMLLVSGATPVLPANIHWLRSAIPLPLVEFSHLTGSLVGVLLLFLARAVLQRIDAAWYGALSLLAIGIVASLLKGLDWQEALVLAGMFAAIFASRRHFYRKSSLLQEPLSPSWLMMIAVVIAGTTWLGFFWYKHIEYSHELWWQFDSRTTPRAARARGRGSLPAFARGPPPTRLRRPEALPTPRGGADPPCRRSIVADPALPGAARRQGLFFDDRRRFIMYGAGGTQLGRDGRSGRTRRSPPACCGGSRGGRPPRRPVALPVREPCRSISTSGSCRSSSAKRRASRWPTSRSRAPPQEPAPRPRRARRGRLRGARRPSAAADDELQADLRRLARSTRTRARRASRSAVSTGYLSRAPGRGRDARRRSSPSPTCGRRRRRRAVGRPDAPRRRAGGVMDFLFIQMMLWGRAQGYQWFDLGMAPLAGLERHRSRRCGTASARSLPSSASSSTTSRACAVQGEVRPGMAAALSRRAARPVGSHHPPHHHAADRRQTRSAQA